MMNRSDIDDPWQTTNNAIREGDLQAVKDLTGKYPSIIREQTMLGSLLHLAADRGQLQVVRYLVENGADINAIAEVGGSPLDLAASEGHVEIIRYLHDRGAEIDVSRPDRNPLFGAICNAQHESAKLLLELGVDPHICYRREDGTLRNALFFAEERGHSEIAELLRAAGCRLPVAGVDSPVNDAPIAVSDARRQRIVEHLAAEFGPVDEFSLQEIVPAMSEVPISVHVIHPNDQHPFWTLFTTGMSFQPMHTPKGQEAFQYAELLLHLPPTWPHPRESLITDGTFWPVQWLRQIAYYPHSNETWLGGPHTIISSNEPPAPLGSNTQQTCLLLIADFGGIEPLAIDGSSEIKFYTMMSLFTEERDFEKQHDLRSLLQRFHERGIPMMIDVHRENVALQRG